MKIAVATLYDARDKLRGSGSYYYLCRQLAEAGHSLAFLGPVHWVPPHSTRIFKKLSTTFGKRYRSFQDIFSAREIGREVTRKLSSIDYDLLITNDYSIAGYVDSEKPIIIYTDAIFPQTYTSNQHPWLDNLSSFSVAFCQYVTRKGLMNSHLCCFASDWAAAEASLYGVKEVEELKVIPYGANFDDPSPDIAAGRIFHTVMARGCLRLLYVGTDWELKGGDVAVGTAEELRKRGILAELHVVGDKASCWPKKDYVKGYGFLSKDKPDERERLHRLFRNCDIFLLPSAAEGFGVAYAEAAAYGLPSLGYQTTGVSTAVKHNISGVLIEKDREDPVAAYADIIQSLFEQPQRYDEMARSSREYYESTVNWSVAAQTLIQEIEAR